MSRRFPGESTLFEIGVSYIEEVCPFVSYDVKMTLIRTLNAYICREIEYERAQQTFLSLIGRCEPVDRIKEIITIPDEPLPVADPPESDDPSDKERKKTRPWTALEDARLLCGIYRFGIDNWTTISNFIGNGRTRAQCCQRWSRGLNPRISKDIWNYEEDVKLIRFVHTLGDKSWTKIASMMGNRSDVQCRYHYHQIIREMPAYPNGPVAVPQMTSQIPPLPRRPCIHPINSSQSFKSVMQKEFTQNIMGSRAAKCQTPTEIPTPIGLPFVPHLVRKNSDACVLPMEVLSGVSESGSGESLVLEKRRKRSNSSVDSLDCFLKQFERNSE